MCPLTCLYFYTYVGLYLWTRNIYLKPWQLTDPPVSFRLGVTPFSLRERHIHKSFRIRTPIPHGTIRFVSFPAKHRLCTTLSTHLSTHSVPIKKKKKKKGNRKKEEKSHFNMLRIVFKKQVFLAAVLVTQPADLHNIVKVCLHSHSRSVARRVKGSDPLSVPGTLNVFRFFLCLVFSPKGFVCTYFVFLFLIFFIAPPQNSTQLWGAAYDNNTLELFHEWDIQFLLLLRLLLRLL